MANCGTCGRQGTDVGRDGMTDWDKAVLVNGSRGGHPAHLVLIGLCALAKYTCSTVYYCSWCRRYWREWFG